MQRAWRSRGARRESLRKIAFESGVLVKGWLMATDPKNMRPFWFKPATEDITWEKPSQIEEAEKELATPHINRAQEAKKQRQKEFAAQALEEKTTFRRTMRKQVAENIVEVTFVGTTTLSVEAEETEKNANHGGNTDKDMSKTPSAEENKIIPPPPMGLKLVGRRGARGSG